MEGTINDSEHMNFTLLLTMIIGDFVILGKDWNTFMTILAISHTIISCFHKIARCIHKRKINKQMRHSLQNSSMNIKKASHRKQHETKKIFVSK